MSSGVVAVNIVESTALKTALGESGFKPISLNRVSYSPYYMMDAVYNAEPSNTQVGAIIEYWLQGDTACVINGATKVFTSAANITSCMLELKN